MNRRAEDTQIRDRLAYLWNYRNALNKAEMAEFYQLLTSHVWTRANVRSLCDTLRIEPRDARHDCFVDKILVPARGKRAGSGKEIAPDGIIGYLNKTLRNYLISESRGCKEIIITDPPPDGGAPTGQTPGTDEPSNPPVSPEFERRLLNDVLPRATEFLQYLEQDDLVLLKCWYAKKPQPALYWFKRVVKNPDYRARRLGLRQCSREFLDYGKTRIGKWAAALGLNLARDRYVEIEFTLEMITVVALKDHKVDCSTLDIGPPASSQGDGQRAD